MRSTVVVACLVIFLSFGQLEVSSRHLGRESQDLVEAVKRDLIRFNLGALANPPLTRPVRPVRSIQWNTKDLELAQDILAAEKLANGIMSDVQSVLGDLQTSKGGKNREFWALIENAMADLDGPKDPKRLLRLS